jgi:Lon protease-like protein
MFPLGGVVLPGELMPLHVFEPRYRRLVLDCLAADPPAFGTTLIERGSEVGGGDERASVGTALLIRSVSPAEGGRFHLSTVGVRRLTVLEWLPDDPYPLADVEEWPDQPPTGDDVELVARRVPELAAEAQTVRQLAATAAGQRQAAGIVRVSDDPVVAGYQLAAAVPLGPADRFRVLQAPSVAARLDVLAEAMADLAAALRFRIGDANDAPGSAGSD